MRTLKPILLLAVLAAVAAALLAAPAAVAAKPCAQQVIDDWWADGRVDRIYELSCYRKAIKDLPVDVRDYSSAADDIGRALQFAREGKPDPGGKDPTPDSTTAGETTGDTGTTETETETGTGGLPPEDPGGPEAGGPILGTEESASSVPVPLLVLGGIALLLLAAGSAGYVTRRLQARRAGGPPAP